MRLVKLVTSVLITIIISISIVSLTVSAAVNSTIFNPSFIKNMLNATSSYVLIYSQIPTLISSFLPDNLARYSTLFGRYLVNNASEQGLKTQAEIIIDNFYLYLIGLNQSPSVDLTPIKSEIKDIVTKSEFQDLTKDINRSINPIARFPDKLNLNETSSSYELAWLVKIYKLFKTLPYYLAAVILMSLFTLFAINKDLNKLLSNLSFSLLASGIILGIIFLGQKAITSRLQSAMLDSLTGPQPDMIMFSLHPMLTFVSYSIFKIILYWSITLCCVGLAAAVFSRRKLRKHIINIPGQILNISRLIIRRLTIPVRKTAVIYFIKRKEPQKGS